MRSTKPQDTVPPPAALERARARPMRRSDLKEIARIEAATFPNPWPLGYFRECLSNGYDCWVMQSGENLDAYAVMSTARGVAHLLNLCVSPAARGRGLGRRMLERMIGAAEGRARSMILEVRVSNAPALALYRSMGFREAGVRRGYYRSAEGGEDALLLIRPLKKERTAAPG